MRDAFVTRKPRENARVRSSRRLRRGQTRARPRLTARATPGPDAPEAFALRSNWKNRVLMTGLIAVLVGVLLTGGLVVLWRGLRY